MTLDAHPPIARRQGLTFVLGLAAACLLVSAAASDPAPADSIAPVDVPEMVAADSAATPAAAAPARAPEMRKVMLRKNSHNVVRTGPGERFAIVGVVPGESVFPVIVRSGDWYNIRLSESESGWIHASLCREFEDPSVLEFRPNPKLYSRTGSFILTGYSGAYAFDRKSNSLALGGRLGYYVFDRLQVEGGVGWTHVKRPQEIVESLFGLSLEAEDFHMLFYHLIVTWELMPGRQMVPYVSGGVGSSIMRGETEPSWNVGAGTTLFLSKRMAMRWEVRDYRFQSGSDNARRSNNNVEFILGTAVLF